MDGIDWKWFVGAIVGAILLAINQLRSRNDVLERRWEGVKTEPFPSDESEEALAIKEAKALCKRNGNTYTFEKALATVKMIRKMRKEREAAKGDDAGGNNKRTA